MAREHADSALQAAPITGGALGVPFSVAVSDDGTRAYISRLLAALDDTAEGRAIEYSIARDGDDTHQYRLVCDEQEVRRAETPEALAGDLIHDLNHRVLQRSGDLLVHAGGVERDGVGIVFPGAMESGKTTITTALSCAGFRYLTDEAVAFDRETLVIRRYPKPLSVDKGAWPLFPGLEPDAPVASTAYKESQWQVEPGALPTKLGQPCRADLLVFPRYRPGEATRLEPMGRAEALYELAQQTFHFDQQGRRALALLAEIVRAAECHRLVASEIDTAGALVADAHEAVRRTRRGSGGSSDG